MNKQIPLSFTETDQNEQYPLQAVIPAEWQPLQKKKKICVSKIHGFLKHKVTLSIIFGQLLSLFICGTATSSEFLQKFNVNVPMMQNFLHYTCLAFVYGSISMYRHSGTLCPFLRNQCWKYFFAALLDVEANYIIVLAYHYTSVTSVQLIDCLTIPTVLICSKFLFKVKYLCFHYLGVLLCLLGVMGMLIADALSKGNAFSGKNPLLGDIFVAIGAILYGFSNVAQEYLVKRYSIVDYLGWIGIFGCLISFIQMITLESKAIVDLSGQSFKVALCFIGYCLSMFLFYSLMPWIMSRYSAVIVNLNLLTADIYALILGIFVFQYLFHWAYLVAYVVIMLGVLIYSLRNTNSSAETAEEAGGELA